jgi:hypothetical protein
MWIYNAGVQRSDDKGCVLRCTGIVPTRGHFGAGGATKIHGGRTFWSQISRYYEPGLRSVPRRPRAHTKSNHSASWAQVEGMDPYPNPNLNPDPNPDRNEKKFVQIWNHDIASHSLLTFHVVPNSWWHFCHDWHCHDWHWWRFIAW